MYTMICTDFNKENNHPLGRMNLVFDLWKGRLGLNIVGAPIVF